ncbi:MAG: ABC transporter ATP-binding protein [Acidimicrobiales bacterium]
MTTTASIRTRTGPAGNIPPAPALELIELRAAYGRIEVLHGVNLTVPTGTVVALLGPNGAGKTTTLNVIGGALEPRSGCVHVAGVHVNGASPDGLARAGVCRIPEGRGIFPNLTVAENLRMCTYSAALSVAEIEEQSFARFPRLGERRGQLAGTMSGGEQQMLAMARALVSRPGLLLLDEISMGLAPLIVSELYSLVGAMAQDGVTVLLTEQFAEMAMEICDFAAVMIHGRIMHVGQPQDVAGYMSEAYLGGVE